MSVQVNSPRMLSSLLSPMVVEPITLEGLSVRLEPLSLDHHASLCQIGLDDDLWRWNPSPVHTADDMREFIELALKRRDNGTVLPFATIHKQSGSVVGSTRYLSIDKNHRNVEIGSTFIGKQWQRTVINTETKYLMLRHAFETWGCLRVTFQTDSLNEKSQRALLRLGASQEGFFRNHKICADGRVRHSIFYSIIDEEWPAIKAVLKAKMASRE